MLEEWLAATLEEWLAAPSHPQPRSPPLVGNGTAFTVPLGHCSSVRGSFRSDSGSLLQSQHLLTSRRLLVSQLGQVGFLSRLVDFAKDVAARGKETEPAALLWRRLHRRRRLLAAKGSSQKGLVVVVVVLVAHGGGLGCGGGGTRGAPSRRGVLSRVVDAAAVFAGKDRCQKAVVAIAFLLLLAWWTKEAFSLSTFRTAALVMIVG